MKRAALIILALSACGQTQDDGASPDACISDGSRSDSRDVGQVDGLYKTVGKPTSAPDAGAGGVFRDAAAGDTSSDAAFADAASKDASPQDACDGAPDAAPSIPTPSPDARIVDLRPADDLAPIVDLRPAVDLAPIIDLRPAVDLAPIVDLRPAVDLAPAVDLRPVVDLRPAVDLAPKDTGPVTTFSIKAIYTGAVTVPPLLPLNGAVGVRFRARRTPDAPPSRPFMAVAILQLVDGTHYNVELVIRSGASTEMTEYEIRWDTIPNLNAAALFRLMPNAMGFTEYEDQAYLIYP